MYFKNHFIRKGLPEISPNKQTNPYRTRTESDYLRTLNSGRYSCRMKKEIVEANHIAQVGWVNINTDGVVGDPHNMAVVGGVIRDEFDSWLFGFNRSLGCCSIFLVKLWAAYDALSQASRLGFRKIELELDNTTSVV
ncbi:hypothetical protein HRI_002068200 [Hibiscus trionum]|uniref:RNase H type-1 domain-containing protein n=1 Tax=Hibiscus trionum TaxID=183268 RepID=A0A9W7M0U3_HIBTR|nr:hypothetical protein HRI_002068200 [Hibiscus trionum]